MNYTIQTHTKRTPIEIGIPRRITWTEAPVKKHTNRWWIINEDWQRIAGYENTLKEALEQIRFLNDPDPAWTQEQPTKF